MPGGWAMKRAISLLLVLAAVLGCFSGCGRSTDNTGYEPTGDAILKEGQNPEDILSEEEDTQELTLAYYPDRSLNPIFGSDYTNRVLMSLMYQGLFAVDNQKNVTPILCGSYQVSADNRTWTFYLENNATFSDGSSVTAQDVVATYNQAMQNDYYKNRFYHVTSVEATENGGVTFYLDTSFGNLPLLLDIPIVKASDVEADLPLGTGPYVFADGAGGASLQRVANWWCGSLKIPATDVSIDLVEVSSPADVRDAFQFGNVSVVCTNPMSATFAEYRCDYELWEIESGYFMYLGCSVFYSDFFESGDLRTFLTYAVDREKYAEEIYGGMVEPVTLPCSPTESYYSQSLASQYGYDTIQFVDHMRTFQIPTDEDTGAQKELRIVVNSADSARVQIARELAQELTDLGLPAVCEEYSGSTYNNVLYYQNYDVYLGLTRLSPNMDLTEFFRPYGEMSRGSLSHETLYSMCLNALENSGNYYNLYKKLAEDGRIIPVLFGYYAVYAQRGLIKDLNPSRDNVFYYSMGKSMDDIRLETEYTE